MDCRESCESRAGESCIGNMAGPHNLIGEPDQFLFGKIS
jgi:hypothetical protein